MRWKKTNPKSAVSEIKKDGEGIGEICIPAKEVTIER